MLLARAHPWQQGETKTLLARAAASFLKGEELQLGHLSSCLGFLNKHLGEEHSAQILRPHVRQVHGALVALTHISYSACFVFAFFFFF